MTLLRSALAVGSNTLFSRIAGFMRDILIARFLGAGTYADIWVAAFRFPNLFRRVIAEGAFSAAFIPVYGRLVQQDGQDKANHFTGNILSLVGLWVFIGIIILQLLMPYLIYLFTPGYSDGLMQWIQDFINYLLYQEPFPEALNLSNDDKIDLTISLTILCMPYAGFMFLTALMSSLLNYHNKFGVPAFTPTLLNLTLVAALLTAAYFDYDPLWALGYGVFISGILQVLWLYVALRLNHIQFKFGRITTDNNILHFKKLFWPGMISGGVTQINILTGSLIASFQSGAMSYLYYADRIYQLPLGVVGVTLGIVLLPTLVKHLEQNQTNQAQNLMARTTEFAAFLTLPASFALIMIPYDVTALLFEYGAFSANDTLHVGRTLVIYGIGLPAFILIKLYAPGYYAKHNTKTPMIYAGYSMGTNIFLGFALFPFIGFYAVPTGTVVAAWQNVVFLYLGLRKNGLIIFDDDLKTRLKKIILACCAMGGVLLMLKIFMRQSSPLQYIIIILAGCVSYFIIAYLLAIFTKTSFKSYTSKQ
ncbi:MAG: murein biosynthesis integral membrane protein MurJ [Pseudomonadota bacterium]